MDARIHLCARARVVLGRTGARAIPFRAAVLSDAMSAAAASGVGARAAAASSSRRARPRGGRVEAPRVAPGRGGGASLGDSETRVSSARVPAGLLAPRRGRACAAARARRKTDWELMDEELRGMRASSGGVTALGVDYGINRTGLAVSAGGIAPRPLDVIPSKPTDTLVRAIVDIAMRERADVIVVGLPVPANLTLEQAAGVTRTPRRRKSPIAADDGNRRVTNPNERLAQVDVSVLLGKRFRSVEDVEDWLGLDGLFRELSKHKMKASGALGERSARLWRLLEARGVLNDVPSRMFPKSSAGKRSAMERAWEITDLELSAEGRSKDLEGGPPAASSETLRGGSKEKTNEKKTRRPPLQMHLLCRRFAEGIADACDVPVELYDESLTSLQADLAVETSRAARGAATARGATAALRKGSVHRQESARVDDVAAALLLERYFAKNHGTPVAVPPLRRTALPKGNGDEVAGR